MKKLILLMTVVVITMTSCKKDTTRVTIDSLPTVTVSGYLKADYGTEMLEAVPVGTILNFSIPNSNYGGGTGNYIITTTTDADGKYTIDIPIKTTAITLSVFGTNFIHSYREANNVTYNKLYYLSPTALTVNPNVNKTQDYTFAMQTITDLDGDLIPDRTVKLSGVFNYQSGMNATHYDTLPIPEGTVFNVYVFLKSIYTSSAKYEKMFQATVGANGAYSVDVPMIEAGVASVYFTGAINLQYKNTIPTPNTNYWYRYNLNVNTNINDYPKTTTKAWGMWTKGTQLSFE